ncbi:hypothetical protein EV361DRAFT_899780 [Lentinula raphanica]|nr:hypothetical protein EV361DRAFT_899780 [Lentinula raphanica]
MKSLALLRSQLWPISMNNVYGLFHSIPHIIKLIRIGYILNTFGWIFSVLIATGVVLTGIFADRGHKWAAGNRAYRRIDG